ncbi:MAG: NAD-dependent epimerase/dehydratase family protein [Acidobacteriaceae bacterium]|nr:NAD-dependent epimerase/dehydratase family protein [Acidobacteriaceae bacterium]MBV9304883.1 NAD-dependent epimerase/dehydratase family protein [Acidobacteriaceae bacterium]
MTLALVTGASGFLGWHVASVLLQRGYRVRALCRPASAVRELNVERVTGDLRDKDSLNRAVEGCQVVFHVAADYRLWSRNPQELYASNVEGTRNVLDAAERAGVERVIYTSTVGCIGMPPDHEGNEETPVSISDMAGHYKRSKWLAEQVALEKARAGLPVVIVNPTAPVGDHDWKPTPTGKIIVDFLRDKLPAFVDTGLNLVDVRDTALGHLLAAERGKPGERYILGCENITLKEILGRLGTLAAKPAPRTQVPYPVAYAAGLISTGWANLTGKPPMAPLEAVRMARKRMFVSTDKAKRELSFQPRPVNEALGRAIGWFRANNYV